MDDGGLSKAKLDLAKANDQITQLRFEVIQLKSGAAEPPSPSKHKETTPSTDHGVLRVTDMSPFVIGATQSDIKSIIKKSSPPKWTRIGIYTVAELEALGEETLVQLDAQVLNLSVKDLSADQFEYIFREAGLKRLRPEHYEFSEEEANRRFNDTGLTVNERNYYQMVQNCTTLIVMNWDNAWWIDRVLYRITMMEYLEWRGMSGVVMSNLAADE